MADVNLYPVEPKKVIGEYTEFFAGQLPTANDFNRWLAVLIAQGDYNTAWLDLIAQKAGVSINELYTELSLLSEIVIPGSGAILSQRLTDVETEQIALETKQIALETEQNVLETKQSVLETNVSGITAKIGTTDISDMGEGTITSAIKSLESNNIEKSKLVVGNGITIERYGKLRCVTFDSYRMANNYTFLTTDRPNTSSGSACVSHEGGLYFRCGAIAIQPNGSIIGNEWSNYNSSTIGAVGIGLNRLVSCQIIYLVE